MKLSTIAFLLASLLAFLLGLFALENVAAGLERNESTTVIAAFDFVDMMSMLRTEDTFEGTEQTTNEAWRKIISSPNHGCHCHYQSPKSW
ncbi:hypothetical protein H9L39_15627 [Fusarium oxysporum f. sp. albedinis]|nr:hypothetical protein FOMA001_g16780 [Fusarium oxysporum f. sp. matthiolae]KAK2473452.1 hypothetical protein H9L39_15627 [Fusarium oxysporum f. sp. albedinis]